MKKTIPIEDVCPVVSIIYVPPLLTININVLHLMNTYFNVKYTGYSNIQSNATQSGLIYDYL